MMVGGGPKKEDLSDKVIKMNLEDEIIFTGMVEHQEIHEYYQAADIFVLPSYTEGLPISILEAMACGLPVVATNVGGIPEVITDGLNGFLVSPKNENELVKKLKILTKNQDLRKQFIHKSLKRINKEFDNNIKVNKLIKFYETVGYPVMKEEK
jgi:glycosyltransferase involved in cell wall biosynthesis